MPFGYVGKVSGNCQLSNKLHVLIKPMLEQWDKLHNDPSCTPTKSKMKKTQSAGIADTGASVLCSGTNLMRQLGLEEKNWLTLRGKPSPPCFDPFSSINSFVVSFLIGNDGKLLAGYFCWFPVSASFCESSSCCPFLSEPPWDLQNWFKILARRKMLGPNEVQLLIFLFVLFFVLSPTITVGLRPGR